MIIRSKRARATAEAVQASSKQAIENTVSLDSIITEFEQDDKMAKQIVIARQEVATFVYQSEEEKVLRAFEEIRRQLETYSIYLPKVILTGGYLS